MSMWRVPMHAKKESPWARPSAARRPAGQLFEFSPICVGPLISIVPSAFRWITLAPTSMMISVAALRWIFPWLDWISISPTVPAAPGCGPVVVIDALPPMTWVCVPATFCLCAPLMVCVWSAPIVCVRAP